MTKLSTLLGVVLVAGVWLHGKDCPPTCNQSDHPTGRPNTFHGCLLGSAGNFTLTDNSGTTYQIQGDASRLREHVGYEVQITGTTSTSTSEADQDTGIGSTNSVQRQIIQLRM